MRRDKVGTPPPASASLSAEPVTQIDNLPVRATAPAHLVGDGNPSRDDRPERPERREGSDRSDRHERRERGGRDDRGERGGRGRRDDRGRGRDRSGERRNQDDRPPATTWEAPGEESTSETDFEPAESTILPDESPDLAGQEEVDEEVEETGRNPRQRRGPRFEAADDEATDRSHLIQEFKPSRHADRSTSPSRQTTSEKKGSLMGWIKSVFTGGDQSTQSPKQNHPPPPPATAVPVADLATGAGAPAVGAREDADPTRVRHPEARTVKAAPGADAGAAVAVAVAVAVVVAVDAPTEIAVPRGTADSAFTQSQFRSSQAPVPADRGFFPGSCRCGQPAAKHPLASRPVKSQHSNPPWTYCELKEDTPSPGQSRPAGPRTPPCPSLPPPS